ncbi:MAG: restriction endonuclease [Caldilineaceae bacterium]|nr:restriction endonuclease [Caldilineaceae bacterium]
MDLLKDIVVTLWALSQIFWPIWLFGLVMIVIKMAMTYRKNVRLAKAGIAEIDKLGGEDFEKYLEMLFRKLGYSVKRTPYHGDFGADLVLQKNGAQTVVQAKRYQRSVGVKAIQEAVAAKDYYQCDNAMVVTNSHYSQQARKLAAANKVELWDRTQLVDQLLSVQQDSTHLASSGNGTIDQQMETNIIPRTNETTPVCVACGKTVSAKVVDYCLSHPEWFGGQIYCYTHQKRVRYHSSQSSI